MKNEKMTIREKAQYLDALADALEYIERQISNYEIEETDPETGEYKRDPETDEIIRHAPDESDRWYYFPYMVWQDIKAAAEKLA